ncbi:hypothetical protein CASFOL_019843 [Castilleja foliolosa]|uniref:Uncharacterized protein n=1 Tax=Castilleja foliolosa TaxID=1961234 RepID=A0ABD3D171_9LAMI
MEKKMVIVLSIFLLIISANFDGVKSQGAGDCLDGCQTGCVNPDNGRLQRRCEIKCQIRCSPELEAKQIT